MRKATMVGLAAALLCTQAQAADKKALYFVVNGASDFWKAAEAGLKKAQSELPNYTLQLKYPEQSSAAIQNRLMDDLVASGAARIMVSAVDPKTQTEELDKIAGASTLFTTDSDAPKTKRIAYVGSSNVDAGKQAGGLMVKALPDGGKCMGLRRPAGRRQRARACRRHQGCDQGNEGRPRRRPGRRYRSGARQAQRRGHADGTSRHHLHGGHLFLQHPADLSGRQGGR